MQNIVKKVTVKEIVGDKKVLLAIAEKGKGNPVAICRIIGLVTKTSVKKTDKGTSIMFGGSFEGTNLQTGELFAGGKCYLPEVVENFVASSFAGEGVESTQFAWEITVKHVPDSIVGYEYGARPIIEEADTNPLAMLRSQVSDALQIEKAA